MWRVQGLGFGLVSTVLDRAQHAHTHTSTHTRTHAYRHTGTHAHTHSHNTKLLMLQSRTINLQWDGLKVGIHFFDFLSC